MKKPIAAKKAIASVKPNTAIAAILRRHLGTAQPLSGVAPEDAFKVARAAYRAGSTAEKKRAAALVAELQEVLDWARIEKAALRAQEIASIERVLAAYNG